jgi:hypothetical protein
MTSPSRRKRPITAREPNTPAPKAVDRSRSLRLVGLALLILAGPTASLQAQSPYAQSSYVQSPYSLPPRSSTGSQWATQSSTVLPVASTPQAPSQAPVQTVPLFKIQPVNYQPPAARPDLRSTDEQARSAQPQIQLEPPGLERLASSVQTEDTLQERIRQEARERNPNDPAVVFPDSPVLSHDTYNGRGPVWAPRTCVVEPYFLCYEKLLTEQRNFERYGWDLGLLTSLISAGTFYLDVALIPYNLATRPCDCADANTGLCLPGDPVPLLLYPPELSLTGTFVETGVILALVAMFP